MKVKLDHFPNFQGIFLPKSLCSKPPNHCKVQLQGGEKISSTRNVEDRIHIWVYSMLRISSFTLFKSISEEQCKKLNWAEILFITLILSFFANPNKAPIDYWGEIPQNYHTFACCLIPPKWVHPGRLTWNLLINHELKGKWSEPNLQGIMFLPLIFQGALNNPCLIQGISLRWIREKGS